MPVPRNNQAAADVPSVKSTPHALSPVNTTTSSSTAGERGSLSKTDSQGAGNGDQSPVIERFLIKNPPTANVRSYQERGPEVLEEERDERQKRLAEVLDDVDNNF